MERNWEAFMRDNPEAGLSGGKAVLAVLLVALLGFLGLKIGGAFLDVNGLKSDIEGAIVDLSIECIGAPCEPEFQNQVEDLMAVHGRDLEVVWADVDYAYTDNMIILPGTKVIDFYVYQYVWHFTHEIQVLR